MKMGEYKGVGQTTLHFGSWQSYLISTAQENHQRLLRLIVAAPLLFFATIVIAGQFFEWS